VYVYVYVYVYLYICTHAYRHTSTCKYALFVYRNLRIAATREEDSMDLDPDTHGEAMETECLSSSE